MGLFDIFKKKETAQTEQTSGCDCSNCSGCGCSSNTADAPIKVLGSGCLKCNELEAATKEALAILGMDTTVDHVTDFAKIAEYGVMSTPALVAYGKVISYGKVLKTDEVVALLKEIKQ
ncbi:MAG: thioredoxin family protein [Clostridia bacterium]